MRNLERYLTQIVEFLAKIFPRWAKEKTIILRFPSHDRSLPRKALRELVVSGRVSKRGYGYRYKPPNRQQ